MIELWIILYLVFAHWVADFLFQTSYMANNKSKSNVALGFHVATYTSIIGIFVAAANLLPPNHLFLWFLVITFILHFATDYITSRRTSQLYVEQRWREFFNTIGFDQVLHYFALFLTYKVLIGL